MLYTSTMNIDKGVPIPEKRRGRKPKYNFAEMEIGDSFFAVGDGSIQVSVLTCARRHLPKKFITQKGTQMLPGNSGLENGFRCWRTE
jgi:hypothetical protein